MKAGEYRDLIASYVARNFSEYGLLVYTEVDVGTTIIGKHRKLDVFVRHHDTHAALGLECKFQSSTGTTDEKIPYALEDVDSMWIPGCVVFGGTGWSSGIRHTLAASRVAVRCEPDAGLSRTKDTLELDHVLAATFGLWTVVVPERRRFYDKQLALPAVDFKRVGAPKKTRRAKKTAK